MAYLYALGSFLESWASKVRNVVQKELMLQLVNVRSLVNEIVHSSEWRIEDDDKSLGHLTRYQMTTWNDILVKAYEY